MKKLLALCLSLVMVFTLASCDSGDHEGEAKTPSASSAQKGRDYQTVVESFEEKGFTNIQLLELDDLVTGWLTKEGEVEYVTVDGNEEYKADTWYANDVEVVIAYHTFPEDEQPTQGGDETEEPDTGSIGIKPPYDNDTSDGVNYKTVVDAFKAAGFTNITTEKRFEASFWGYEEDTVANIYIDGHTFSIDREYDADSEIRIDYYVITEADTKSDTELTKFYAQKAFEDYGAALYPYGFECHWIVNCINAEQYDDGSWFFKVGVTVENQYGNKVEGIAEGIVSGTDTSPTVTQFYVD